MQKSKRKMSNIEKKYMVAGFAFLTPAIVIYLIFAVIPFFDSFILSFQEWSGFGPRTFLGLKNYFSAFRDKTFLLAIRNSVYLGVASAFFSVIICREKMGRLLPDHPLFTQHDSGCHHGAYLCVRL